MSAELLFILDVSVAIGDADGLHVVNGRTSRVLQEQQLGDATA